MKKISRSISSLGDWRTPWTHCLINLPAFPPPLRALIFRGSSRPPSSKPLGLADWVSNSQTLCALDSDRYRQTDVVDKATSASLHNHSQCALNGWQAQDNCTSTFTNFDLADYFIFIFLIYLANWSWAEKDGKWMVKEGRKLQHYFAISPDFSMQMQAGADGVYFN